MRVTLVSVYGLNTALSFRFLTKIAMEKMQKTIKIGLLAAMALFIAGGLGYFVGRYQQIVIQQSVLTTIPDVNCGSK